MSTFSEPTRAFLRRSARSARGFTRRALVKWLKKRRSPVFEAHLAWEEALAHIAERDDLSVGGEGLLEIGDLRFGAVGLHPECPDWAVERRPEGVCVLVGAISSHTRLYMDAEGQLYRQFGALWTLLAASPFAYVERLAIKSDAAPWALEVPGRVGAALAAALAVPRLEPASDAATSVWSDARLSIFDGRWHWPRDERATVFVRDAAGLAPLLQALSTLDLPACVEPLGEATLQDADKVLDAAPPGATLPLAAPTDLCSGEIGLEGSALIQVVRDEAGAIVERGTFALDQVTLRRRMRASAHLGKRVTERARADLDQRRFLRDPRWTCSPEALSALLAARGLPVLGAALDFERWLGGFVTRGGLRGDHYGVFEALRRLDEFGRRGGSDPPQPGGLTILEEGWPHVRWRGMRLLPVGDLTDEVRFYVGEDGIIYEHVELIDELYPVAAGPRQLIEGQSINNQFGAMYAWALRIAADMGEVVGRALGLTRDEDASDRVRSYWHAPDVLVRAEHGVAGCEPVTRVTSKDEARLAAAVRAVFAADPGAKVGASHMIFKQMQAVDPRVERSRE